MGRPRCDYLPNAARGEEQLSKSSKVPISQVDGRRDAVLSQARYVTCSVRDVQQRSHRGRCNRYVPGMMLEMCAAAGAAAGCM